MKIEQCVEKSELNSQVIPPCYQNIENDALIIDFWNDSKKVEEFMQKRKEKNLGKSRKLDFCCSCKWDKDCVGLPKEVADNFQKNNMLLRLGYGCNQKCIFCTVDKYDDCNSKKYITEPTLYGMTTEDAKKEILARKPYELTFTGEKPLLFKEIFDTMQQIS